MDQFSAYVIVVYAATFGVLLAYLGYLFARLRQEPRREEEAPK